MAIDLATGTTVTFGTSSFSANWLSINGPNITRAAINTSHLGTTTAHTYVPGALYDGGEFSGTFQWDASLTVPITGSAETITIDWAGNGDTSSFSGFITNVGVTADGGESESLMTADLTIKVTGAVTL